MQLQCLHHLRVQQRERPRTTKRVNSAGIAPNLDTFIGILGVLQVASYAASENAADIMRNIARHLHRVEERRPSMLFLHDGEWVVEHQILYGQ